MLFSLRVKNCSENQIVKYWLIFVSVLSKIANSSNKRGFWRIIYDLICSLWSSIRNIYIN
ncbi:hypothetical protein BpHYR1_028139 [Brachionus plicatilis]|uniref:Uncharacterized protein n=1 Tax=Brachionus plicatilis TaxID=10195 RepID=A0A3M7PN22_BRAPC|nr:hypothetical protein BpHYR1_028139 [Brachionus plicatilis]